MSTSAAAATSVLISSVRQVLLPEMNLDQSNISAFGPFALKMLVSVGGALLVLATFWIAAWIVKALIARLAASGKPHRRDVVNLIGSTARWTIIGFGIV